MGKPLLGEKYVEGKKERRKKKKERVMPSLVATTSALARTTCVRKHYVRTNSLHHAQTWDPCPPFNVRKFFRNILKRF